MPRQINVATENNFKGGYVTEATGLNFPENACTAADNCIFDEKGRVYRRPGFDYEQNYELATVNTDESSIRGFTWKNVGNVGTTSFRVEQIGSMLYFYQVSTSAPVSTQLMSDTIDLNDYAAAATVDPSANPCSFASTNKYLVVTHPQCEPFFVSYDPTDDSFIGTQVSLQVRDFEGLDDTLDIDERPVINIGSITKEHKYNLYNQGWYFNSAAALTAWDAAFTDLPSNADIWWQFKNADDEFDTTVVPNRDMGNTLAPRGHFVLDVFDQDRSAISGVSSIAVIDTGVYRPSNCCFFAGRVFYSGLNSVGYGNKIYFSQIIVTNDQFGKCYQASDPTSEIAFDLLPDDGGVIVVFEVENIIKMVPMGSSLIVFATNGIWAITGSQGLGFTATDYSIAKIDTTPCLSESSFIFVDNLPIWWNTEGIFALTNDQSGFKVQSLTDKTIRTDFLSIPTRSKLFAIGAYDSSSKNAKWIFRRAESSSTTDDYSFDSVISINFLTGAFYLWTIPDSDIIIHDLFSLVTVGGAQSLDQIYTEGDDPITDDASDPVLVSSLSTTVVRPQFKYLVSNNGEITFAECSNLDYLDWVSADDIGTDFISYFITGYRLDGNVQNFFQANYVFIFLENEDDSSCFMQGIWDYATSGDSGLYSSSQQTIQQVFHTNFPHRSVNYRRLKLRGKGRALQLRFDSETGKPFTIIGWSLFETSNASI